MSSAYNTDGMFTIPETQSASQNVFESIKRTIAFDVRCWTEERRLAWIYYIVFGFDENSEEDKLTASDFRWDPYDIKRLHNLHRQWEEATYRAQIRSYEQRKTTGIKTYELTGNKNGKIEFYTDDEEVRTRVIQMIDDIVDAVAYRRDMERYFKENPEKII